MRNSLWQATLALAAAACAPSDSGTTLRVALWAGGHELEIERQVADRYEVLHPGVRIVLESAPNGYEERLLTSIAAGRPPDVYLMDSPDIPTFVERGLAVDLAPYQEALGFRPDSVFEPVADAFRRGESMFALPKDFTPMVLYANRDVLAAAGVEDLLPAATGASPAAPPASWTWTDFRRAAEAVVAGTDGGGRQNVFGFDFPRNLYQWIPFVWSAGGDILAPDGSGTAGYLDGPEALEAYRFLTALAEDGLTPGAQFVQQGVSMGIENVRVLGIEDVRVRALLRGGSGATGAGQRAGSEVVMRGSLSRQAIRRPLGSRGGGSPWRVRRGGASGSCCPGC